MYKPGGVGPPRAGRRRPPLNRAWGLWMALKILFLAIFDRFYKGFMFHPPGKGRSVYFRSLQIVQETVIFIRVFMFHPPGKGVH